MNREEKKLLKTLESTGEEQVRLNLAKDLYGILDRNLAEAWLKNKEIEREKDQLKHIGKQTRTMRITTIGACFSVAVSIAAFVISIRACYLQQKEDLDIFMSHVKKDYETEIIEIKPLSPLAPDINKRFLLTYFNCIILNNSDKSISITDIRISEPSSDFFKLSKDELFPYTGPVCELLKNINSPLEMPIIIEPHKNVGFLLKIGIQIDHIEFSIGKKFFPAETRFSIKRYIDFLEFEKVAIRLESFIKGIEPKDSKDIVVEDSKLFMNFFKEEIIYIMKIYTARDNYFQHYFSCLDL